MRLLEMMNARWLRAPLLVLAVTLVAGITLSCTRKRQPLDALVGRTHILLSKGEFDKALTVAEEAADLYEQRAEVFLLVGQVRWAMADFSGALEATNHALALSPGNAGAMLLRADLNALLGRHQEEERDYLAVLRHDPGNWIARYGRCRSLYDLGAHNDELVKEAHRLIEATGRCPSALIAAGALCRSLGRLEEAREWYEEAVEKEPRNLTARLGRGMLACDLEEYVLGIPDLEYVLERNASSAVAHFAMSVCLAATSEPAEALRHAEEAKRLGFVVTEDFLETLRQATRRPRGGPEVHE